MYLTLFLVLHEVAYNVNELVLFIFQIETSTTLNDLDDILHILFVFLPLLWSFGILPQIDCLFLWAIEVIFVFILGGTPTLNDIRLILGFLLACGGFGVVRLNLISKVNE